MTTCLHRVLSLFVVFSLLWTTTSAAAIPDEGVLGAGTIMAPRQQEPDQGPDSSDTIYLPSISNRSSGTQPTRPPATNTPVTPTATLSPTPTATSTATPTPTPTPRATQDPTPTTPPSGGENPGWVIGKVFNSTTCNEHLTACQPLAGVTIAMSKVDTIALMQARAARRQQLIASNYSVSLAPAQNLAVTTPVSGTILTAADGSFHFPIAVSGIYWLRAEKDGYTYGQREVEVVIGRSTATDALYLTPLDTAVTNCTSAGCQHTNSDGSIQLAIPAGAIPDGETVPVTATNFEQVEYLPSGDLPEGTWETYAFNLGGDSEYIFQPGTQATVRIKNDKGFAPGTQIPLGYWNQATQAWEHAGTGIVDGSGEWVEMGVTHFSNYDCNDPISEPDIDADTGGEDGGGASSQKDGQCNGASGCFINYKSGTLHEWVDLPPVQVLNERIAPQLRYSTDRAQPSEVIDVDLKVNATGATDLGNYIGYELYIEGQKTDSFFFEADLGVGNDAGRFRYLWDGRNAQGDQLPSGVYDYEVKLSVPYKGQYCYALNGVFGNPPDCVNGATGKFVEAVEDLWVKGTVTLDARQNSPLGSGWVLNSHQRLYEDSNNRLLIVDGQEHVQFSFPGKPFVTENQENVSSTLAWITDHASITGVKGRLTGMSEDAARRWIGSKHIALSPGGNDYFTISPDQNFAYITNDGNSSLLTVDLRTQQQVAQITIGSSPEEIVLSPDGSFLYFVNSANNTLSKYNIAERREVVQANVGKRPTQLALSPDGLTAYVVNETDRSVSVVNLTSFQTLNTINLTLNSFPPVDIVISPDGSKAYISSANPSDRIDIVDLSTQQVLNTINGIGGQGLALSPQGDYLYVVSTANDKLSRVNLTTRQIDISLYIGDGAKKIVLSPQGEIAYVVNSHDQSVTAIDLNSYRLLGTATAGRNLTNDIKLSPDGTIAYILDSQELVTIDTASIRELAPTFIASRNILLDLVLSSDARYAYATDTKAILQFDLEQQIELDRIALGSDPIAITLSPDNKYLYAVSQRDDVMSVVDLAAQQEVRRVGTGQNPSAVAISHDGQFILIANSSDNTLLMLSSISFQEIATIPVGNYPVTIAASPISPYAYVGNSFSRDVSVVDLASQREINRIQLERGPYSIAVSPDALFAYVVRGSVDTLSVIDLTTQQQIASIPAGDSPEEVVLSSDGNYAYVRFGALGDRGVSIIDLQAQELKAVIDTRKEPSAIAISKVSNQVFSLTATDHSTVTFDPDSGTYTRSYPNGVQVHFNPDGTHDYTLEPDGRKTVYTYNPGGSIATMGIVPPGDNVARWVWTFNYANGKLVNIIDPANRTTRFTIGSNGDLVEAITPDQATQRFVYDGRHLLTGHTDENNETTTYTYDAYGRISTITEPARAVYNPATGTTENRQEVRTFTPSDTSYPLINDSPVGDPDNPAPAVPKSAELIDRVRYGRGEESGHTNRWGSWLDETDALGRTTTYERDLANNVTRQTYPNGDCVEYGYDSTGNTLSEAHMAAAQCALAPANRDPAQVQQWQYSYEPRFNQIKVEIDPLGNTTTYTYDYEEGVGEAGKLIRVEYPAVANAEGVMTTPTVRYTYNNLGLRETETNERGTVTRYTYNAKGWLTERIDDANGLQLKTVYGDFDGAGHPQTVTDPRGNVTRYTYDVWGNMTTMTDALGYVTRYEYDGRQNLVRKTVDYTADGTTGRNIVTTYTYDVNDLLLSERTAADGLVQSVAYQYDINRKLATETDANGNLTTYRYDADDQMVGVVDALGQTTTYSYTLRGQLATIAAPDGDVVRYVYDAFDRRVAEIVDDGGLNLTTGYGYDHNGNLLTTTATDGVVTCYEYDARNRRTGETLDCGGFDLATRYGYDVGGNLVRMTNERGVVTANSYDALDRLTQSRQDATRLNLITTYAYDAAGNLVRAVDHRGTVTTFTYDAANRRTVMAQDAERLALTTEYGYDRLHNQNRVTDPNGIVNLSTYNAFGLPTREVQDANGLAATITYVYDNNLNLVTITDDNGNSTRYTYDARDQLTETRYADNTTVTLTYNPDRTLATRTDQAGDRVTYTYDGADRLLRKSYPDGSFQSFAYDAAGRTTRAGQTMSGHTTEDIFVYNALGDVTQSTQRVDGNSWQVGYAYDYVAGAGTTIYPSGTVVTHTLDTLNRLANVRQDGGNVATYGYNDAAGSMSLAHANGVTTQIDTDALYRITRIQSAKAPAVPFADYRYGYDKVGNRIYMQRQHKTGAPADVYQYDGLYQLTRVWYGANATDPAAITAQDSLQNYQLDTLGNRLSLQQDGTTETYLPNDGTQLTNPMNRYEQVDSGVFQYDAKGNTLADGRNTYTYDYENRQIGMSGPGGVHEYVYNSFGRRIVQIRNGIQEYFVYGTQFQLLEIHSSDNQLISQYIYGKQINEPLRINQETQSYSYHKDALFSTVAMTNLDGNLVEFYEYDVFGKPQFFDASNTAQSDSVISNPLLYTGYEFDAESGNYYSRARIYVPAIGRFLQIDPIGYIDGLNLYVYSKANPTTYLDPSGLACGSGWNDLIISDTPVVGPPDPRIPGRPVDFTNACVNHDRCYGICNNSKSLCDRDFYRDMETACYLTFDSSSGYLSACLTQAGIYFTAVDLLGNGPYKNAQREARQENGCPCLPEDTVGAVDVNQCPCK